MLKIGWTVFKHVGIPCIIFAIIKEVWFRQHVILRKKYTRSLTVWWQICIKQFPLCGKAKNTCTKHRWECTKYVKIITRWKYVNKNKLQKDLVSELSLKHSLYIFNLSLVNGVGDYEICENIFCSRNSATL